MINFSVTIIITTFNRDQYLKDCLDSILKQSYKYFKIIIVSDGDFESTTSLINSYNNEKIQLISNVHTGIPSVSRNIGIMKSYSDLICFCDDDDIWESNKLFEQVQIFNKNPNCLVYTNIFTINSNNIEITQKNNLLIDTYNYVLKKNNFFLFFKNYICLSSIMITTDLAKRNLFNESIEYRGSEDYLFLLNYLSYKNPIFYLKEKLVGYRIHESNLSSNTLNGYSRSIKILDKKAKDFKLNKYPIILIAKFFYHLKYIIKSYKVMFTK